MSGSEMKSNGENGTAGPRKRIKRNSRTLSTGDATTVDAILLAKACPQLKNSRRSRNGRGRGAPKKGGAGGKGTWGTPGSELQPDFVDHKDPNYDSEAEKDNLEFEAITPAVKEEDLEKVVSPLIVEYFEHGDTNEVIMSLEELNLSNVRAALVALVVQLSLERKPSHREMCSVLLSDCYDRILEEEDYENGFKLLLESIGDISLDTPEAATWIGNFAARCIADDCLAPKFLQEKTEKPLSPKAQECLAHASALLKMPHGLVRLDNVWGTGGGMRPVQSLVKQIQLLIREYLVSEDIQEAQRCLRELEVPHFHHELVYEALLFTIEDMHDAAIGALVKLLKACDESGIITPQQMQRGFDRVYSEMNDIVIDVPPAYSVLERIVDKCLKEGNFLPEKVVTMMPSRGRKRFVSEGDGGRVKDC
ncbi:programmed cell death protein 4 [Galendromus occidentalis]|uniref:Programmed cell death protein 4 n=1 Tax=Galendromus occidentalis TaxID=34638 RepID=A0AAJ6QR14_9ACAR|nr:programmed cell death protein 4 [Galendromus occidentalis]